MKTPQPIIFACFLLLLMPTALSVTTLTGSGCSVSTVGYLVDIAQEYEKETGVKMHIIGGGSLRGISDLASNKVDFAASCKGPTPDDPPGMTFIRVAWDALVFIVHKTNPIDDITPKQVRDIYAGTITNWKQLGGADLPLKSFISTTQGMGGIGQSLTSMVLNGIPVMPQGNSSMQASTVAIWEQLVERTSGGFTSTGFSSAKKRNVKMLRVNGVPPIKQNIISDKYPFRRPLYIVLDSNPSPDVKKFVDFLLSPKAQGLIASYGMVSLAEVK